MGHPNNSEISTTPFWIRVFWDLCWAWALIGVAVGSGRVLAHDSHLFLVVANCLSLYIYAPAVIVFPIAVWKSRHYLAIASGLLVVAQLVWVAPDFFPAQRTEVVAGSPSLRVFSANLYMDNKSPEGTVDEINACDPDVILLQEFSPIWQRTLSRSGIMDKYPHTVMHSREDSFGAAVLSKQPFLEKTVWIIGEVPIISVGIQWQGSPIRIYNWHPLPPRTFEYFKIWNNQYHELLQRLSRETGPVLLIGDFNATQHNLWMKRLLSSGYQSAHIQTGRGYAVTYPNGTSRVPPIRLDHALSSKHFLCEQIREGIGHGSDHKPLIVDFVLLPVSNDPLTRDSTKETLLNPSKDSQ